MNESLPKRKILFVCHGNICRSPMAERVMKDLVVRRGLAADWEIASAATSREEIGHGIYPPAARLLSAHGISAAGHAARQITAADYAYYDHIIYMDRQNHRNLLRVLGGDPQGKMTSLLSYTGQDGEVADPWYTGDFEETYRDVLAGCLALLEIEHK